MPTSPEPDLSPFDPRSALTSATDGPGTRPGASTTQATPATADEPGIAWPLVERRRPQSAPRTPGQDRRSGDGAAAGRYPSSAAPPLAVFRWVAIGVGLVIAWPNLSSTSYRLLFGAIALIAYAAYRTARPIPTRTTAARRCRC